MCLTKRLISQLSSVALLCLAAASPLALAQSRTCIIDEVNGQHRCGYLADEQGYRIADRPVYTQPAPVIVAPVMPPAPEVIGRPGYRSAFEERRAAEQKRMEVQEWVNSLFLDVLGRDADIVTLRRDADPSGLKAQMAGLRSGLTLAQIRQAIAESPEGRARR